MNFRLKCRNIIRLFVNKVDTEFASSRQITFGGSRQFAGGIIIVNLNTYEDFRRKPILEQLPRNLDGDNCINVP